MKESEIPKEKELTPILACFNLHNHQYNTMKEEVNLFFEKLNRKGKENLLEMKK